MPKFGEFLGVLSQRLEFGVNGCCFESYNGIVRPLGR